MTTNAVTNTGPSITNTPVIRVNNPTAGSSNDPNFTSSPTNAMDQVLQDIRQDNNPVMNNTIDMDISPLIGQDIGNISNLVTQDRLDIRIFPPALNTWRQLRGLQGYKIQNCVSHTMQNF